MVLHSFRMNISPPAPALNPVSAAWKETLASMKPLAGLYAIGLIPIIAMGFAENRLLSSLAIFSFDIDGSLAVWVAIILVSALLLGWYTVHLLLALSRHRAQQPLPSPMDSLRRVPHLFLGWLVSLLVIAGPILALLLVFFASSFVAGAQEAGLTVGEGVNLGTMNDALSLQTGSEEAIGYRLMNIFQGGVGLLALIAGAFWAIYSSLRLSQISLLILLDNLTAIEALKRSWSMMKGQLGYVFGWGIVLGVFTFLLDVPAGIIDGLLGTLSKTLAALAPASNLLSAFLIAPWASFCALEIFARLKSGTTRPVPSTQPPIQT